MIPEGNPRQRHGREEQVLLHVDIAIFRPDGAQGGNAHLRKVTLFSNAECVA